MAKNKGWNFLFGPQKEYGSFSDSEGNEGYIYSDGSGYFHGADGSDGYIYSDGSGYFHGSDGSDGYKYSDGSGYFRGGRKSVDAYQYSDGSGYYEDSETRRENYSSRNELNETSDSADSSAYSDSGSDSVGIGGALLGLGLVGLAFALSGASSSKKAMYDGDAIDATDNRYCEVKSNSNNHDFKIAMLCLCLVALIPFCILLGIHMHKTISENQGKVCAGSYRDLIDQNYEDVEAHLRAAGFTNIELVDLDDAGLAFWANEKVSMISIGGVTYFDSTDYFYPDTKVIISYH